MSNFIKIYSVEAELFHENRQTDGRTDMKKLKAFFFRNFAMAPRSLGSKVIRFRRNLNFSKLCC
jgi:hypothetical protein